LLMVLLSILATARVAQVIVIHQLG